MILDGQLPEVEMNEHGRYEAPRDSLPRIAKAVGLTVAELPRRPARKPAGRAVLPNEAAAA